MKYVKVVAHRDLYGLGTYKLKEYKASTRECLLVHDDPKVPKEGFLIYLAHTFSDSTTRKLNADAMGLARQQAQTIGLPKAKPGKK